MGRGALPHLECELFPCKLLTVFINNLNHEASPSKQQKLFCFGGLNCNEWKGRLNPTALPQSELMF